MSRALPWFWTLALAAGTALAQPETAGPTPPPAPGLDPPTPVGATSYRLSPGASGPILAWHDVGDGQVRLRWSRLTDAGWTEPATAYAAKTGIVANWADLPAVVEGGDGAMYAQWLRRTAKSGEAYDAMLLRSIDGGQTWVDLGRLNDDDTAATHGFVSYAPIPEGLRVFWLDGRETGAHTGIADAPSAGHMTLRSAVVGERISPSILLDDSVCDCCDTAAAATSRGPLAVYRDRAEGEIRDIAAVGGPLAAPRIVHDDHWKMPGCPVNGPALVASGDRAVVAWYTGSPGAMVQASFSDDAGATFSPPIEVDRTAGAAVPIGRVDLVADGDGAIVVWLRSDRRKGVLLAQRVSRDGVSGEPVVLAPMNASRDSGFPQAERLGDRLIVVWRDTEADTLRTAVTPLSAIGG
ncbi:MAG: hypothetical protein IPJ41_02315 [Phycisphaerales bacterium]|nr:hypothetical protein [Phycisphaerales bacterium]